jgi:catechol 2,3-dioxygenase-like lactoylglutathione lyase family enzyme
MEWNVEQLLNRYESGNITRRDLICALAATSIASRNVESISPFEAVSLNHVTMRVSDAQRSARFYRQLLGLPVLKEKASAVLLRVGSSFLALDSAPPEESKGIDHFSFGIRGFTLEQAGVLLKKAGLEPEVAQNVELYFRDPDGIRVQLSAPDYAGHP